MTAVELLVSIGILSIAGVALVSMSLQSMTGWSRGAGAEYCTSQATIAIQKLSNDIRDARSAVVESGSLVVTFPLRLTDTSTGQVVYDPSGTDPVSRYYYVSDDGNLMRRVGSVTSVLARGITSAAFSVHGDLVWINLASDEQVGKCESTYETEGRVALRNYQD